MFKRFSEKFETIQEPRNPDGLTYSEFMEKYKDIREVAALCWRMGITPEQLKEQLKTVNEKY